MKMEHRTIGRKTRAVGAVHWNRRLFDSLIPLPDGTSYNSYLIEGSEKTVLMDTVDPEKVDILHAQLDGVNRLDHIISHHAEQDHAGSIGPILERFPGCTVVTTAKGKELLMDHLGIQDEKFITVSDGDSMSLGDLTLEFIHTPWVHWPETMVTYLREEKILFSCDWFGSHIATNDLFVKDQGRVYEAAKRYYAEIMMPFRKIISKNIEKIEGLEIDYIAPSHGPVYDDPSFIIDAYREWIQDTPRNLVVIPYVSMHGSTQRMVEQLTDALTDRGISVALFDLAVTDIGKLAIELVDAATVIVGTPTVAVGPHPLASYAATLANIIRPKARFISIIGSYGWHSKAVETLAGLIPNLKVDIIDPVICKGFPGSDTLDALTAMAETIAVRHRELGL